MNAKEREAKKKELYRLSWETKWKYYKEEGFSHGSACSFCEYLQPNNLTKIQNFLLNVHIFNRFLINSMCRFCLVDSDICYSRNSQNNMIAKLYRCNPIEEKQLIEKVALEIKKRGGIDK